MESKDNEEGKKQTQNNDIRGRLHKQLYGNGSTVISSCRENIHSQSGSTEDTKELEQLPLETEGQHFDERLISTPDPQLGQATPQILPTTHTGGKGLAPGSVYNYATQSKDYAVHSSSDQEESELPPIDIEEQSFGKWAQTFPEHSILQTQRFRVKDVCGTLSCVRNCALESQDGDAEHGRSNKRLYQNGSRHTSSQKKVSEITGVSERPGESTKLPPVTENQPLGICTRPRVVSPELCVDDETRQFQLYRSSKVREVPCPQALRKRKQTFFIRCPTSLRQSHCHYTLQQREESAETDKDIKEVLCSQMQLATLHFDVPHDARCRQLAPQDAQEQTSNMIKTILQYQTMTEKLNSFSYPKPNSSRCPCIIPDQDQMDKMIEERVCSKEQLETIVFLRELIFSADSPVLSGSASPINIAISPLKSNQEEIEVRNKSDQNMQSEHLTRALVNSVSTAFDIVDQCPQTQSNFPQEEHNKLATDARLTTDNQNQRLNLQECSSTDVEIANNSSQHENVSSVPNYLSTQMNKGEEVQRLFTDHYQNLNQLESNRENSNSFSTHDLRCGPNYMSVLSTKPNTPLIQQKPDVDKRQEVQSPSLNSPIFSSSFPKIKGIERLCNPIQMDQGKSSSKTQMSIRNYHYALQSHNRHSKYCMQKQLQQDSSSEELGEPYCARDRFQSRESFPKRPSSPKSTQTKFEGFNEHTSEGDQVLPSLHLLLQPEDHDAFGKEGESEQSFRLILDQNGSQLCRNTNRPLTPAIEYKVEQENMGKNPPELTSTLDSNGPVQYHKSSQTSLHKRNLDEEKQVVCKNRSQKTCRVSQRKIPRLFLDSEDGSDDSADVEFEQSVIPTVDQHGNQLCRKVQLVSTKEVGCNIHQGDMGELLHSQTSDSDSSGPIVRNTRLQTSSKNRNGNEEEQVLPKHQSQKTCHATRRKMPHRPFASENYDHYSDQNFTPSVPKNGNQPKRKTRHTHKQIVQHNIGKEDAGGFIIYLTPPSDSSGPVLDSPRLQTSSNKKTGDEPNHQNQKTRHTSPRKVPRLLLESENDLNESVDVEHYEQRFRSTLDQNGNQLYKKMQRTSLQTVQHDVEHGDINGKLHDLTPASDSGGLILRNTALQTSSTKKTGNQEEEATSKHHSKMTCHASQEKILPLSLQSGDDDYSAKVEESEQNLRPIWHTSRRAVQGSIGQENTSVLSSDLILASDSSGPVHHSTRLQASFTKKTVNKEQPLPRHQIQKTRYASQRKIPRLMLKSEDEVDECAGVEKSKQIFTSTLNLNVNQIYRKTLHESRQVVRNEDDQRHISRRFSEVTRSSYFRTPVSSHKRLHAHFNDRNESNSVSKVTTCMGRGAQSRAQQFRDLGYLDEYESEHSPSELRHSSPLDQSSSHASSHYQRQEESLNITVKDKHDEVEKFFLQRFNLAVEEIKLGTKLAIITPPVKITPEICYVQAKLAEDAPQVRIPIHLKHIFRVLCSPSTSRRSGQPNGVVFVFYVTPGMSLWMRSHFANGASSAFGTKDTTQLGASSWFNPESTIEERRRMVFLSQLGRHDNEKLCDLFKKYGVLTVLSEEEMNEVLENRLTNEMKQLCTLQIPAATNKRHLIDEMLDKRREKWSKAGILFIYPPPPVENGITIRNDDFESLKPLTFITPSIVDFWLRYQFEEEFDEELRDKYYLMRSSFYRQYTQRRYNKSTHAERHDYVRGHTRDVNIFVKEYIIFPLYDNCHWVLAVVCFPSLELTDDSPSLDESTAVKPAILYFDSRGHERRIPIEQAHKNLTQYLTSECVRQTPGTPRSFNRLPSLKVPCTQLTRHITDSGIYLLKMVAKFLQDPIIPPFNQPRIWLKYNDKRPGTELRDSLRRKIVELYEESKRTEKEASR